MKRSMAAAFLTEKEKQKITAAVKKAEAKSSGEIVPMIVSRSYSYPLATHLGALLFSIPFGLFLTPPLAERAGVPSASHLVFLGLFAMFYIVLSLLIPRIPRLQKLFLAARHVDEEVREGAITAFFSEQLYKTEKENGVLLYISVFEQKVWILGDAGINAVIPSDYWDNIVEKLVGEIKAGNRCDGICRAIETIGDTLRDFFPAERDDVDELHNLIIKD